MVGEVNRSCGFAGQTFPGKVNEVKRDVIPISEPA